MAVGNLLKVTALILPKNILSLNFCFPLFYYRFFPMSLLGEASYLVLYSFFTDVSAPSTGISTSQDRYLNTRQHRHTINVHSNPSLEWDLKARPSIRASEEGSCLNRAATVIGYYRRLNFIIYSINFGVDSRNFTRT